MLVLVACGCRNETSAPGQPENTDHQNDTQGSYYTLFSPSKEFFIKHETLEAGHESEFLVHVTNLDTYSPCTTGTVTILIDGVSVTSNQPRKPGIFVLPFQPAREGAFEMQVTLQTGEEQESLTDHVRVFADHPDLHSATADSHDHEEAETGDITFLKEQAWKSEFMVSRVEKSSFSAVILTSGELIAPPGKIKRVSAGMGGIISFAHKNLVQGSSVQKGQHLFTISGKSLPGNSMELQLQQAFNSLEKSRSEYTRHRKLHTQGAISDRQLTGSRSIYTADSLRYYNLASSTTEEGLKVFAPVSGSIHILDVSEGEYVETGHSLVTISSDQILLLRADLPQQYHDIARDIVTANFRTAYWEEAFPISDFSGQHLATGHSVAENDHYLPVYFELQNDGRLLEGAFAEIYLKTTPVPDRITIPLGAISEEQGNHYVYLQVTGESYTKQAVTTGAHDGRQVEVIKGLEPGDRIVTKGVVLVKAATEVAGITGHGHSH